MVRLDIADLEPAAVLDADLCVIGGGPAGLGLARELIDSPHDVILLESGGQTLEGETQKLYSGVVSGTLLDAWPGYLAMSRLRYLGGSSNHWQGWCRRHDPIDYEVRDWVPESGWPLELEQLAPFYERAARLCRIPQFDDERDRAHLHALLLGEESDFETSFLHISPPVRFGESYAPELAAARNVRLITHANVVRLEADESGRRVVSVEAMSLDGRRLTIRPRALVLACGGIENARLLLASARESGGGFGNNRDLVGRYFMEHPSVHFGYVVIPYWRWLMRSYSSLGFGGHKQFIRAVLRPSEALQRREHLLNSIFIFDHVDLAEAPALWAEISALATDVLQIAEGHANPKPGTNYLGTFRAEVEQIPDRENRVTLAETRDALEMPRASLRWTLDDRSEASLRATVDALVRALGVTLHARVQLLTDGSALWERSWPSNHHMGTTRMASSPDRGVVDADCRVHGMDNLWIAGSSVFPTSGCSNPTLTLIALALRLADHLRERLS